MIIFSLRMWFGLFLSLLKLDAGVKFLERKLPVIRYFTGCDDFPEICKPAFIKRMVGFKVILIEVF